MLWQGKKNGMRFCFVSSNSSVPWGGSEELWSQAALRLLKQGHDVSASVSWWPKLSPKVVALADEGVRVFVRPAPRPGLPARIWNKFKRSVGGRRVEDEWLLSQSASLTVISQGANRDGLAWMNLCENAGLPYAALVQCNAEEWWPRDEDHELMCRLYPAAQRVFCVSRRNLDLLEQQLGGSLPNGEVVWNPYNVSTEQPPEWPLENGIWKLACVARLEPPAKGQDLLFQVLSRQEWKARPIELNLFGSGPCGSSLKRLASHWQLSNIQFRGHVPDVREIWRENHLLVLPSRYEGLPLALMEAMWCGRAAVVTDIGGSAEVCEDEKTGFVAAAPTAHSFGQALERAWERRGDWREMGRAARQRAQKIIPLDPVDDFCQRLTKIAEVRQTGPKKSKGSEAI